MASPRRLFNVFAAPRVDDQRFVAGRAQELDDIAAGEPGGAGVDQRMEIEPLVAIIVASSTTVTAALRSLIAPNGVTAPGLTPQTSSSSSAEPKETPPLAADLLVRRA